MEGLVLYTGEGSLARRLCTFRGIEAISLKPKHISIEFGLGKQVNSSVLDYDFNTNLLQKEILKEATIKMTDRIFYKNSNTLFILAGFHYILPHGEDVSDISYRIRQKQIINFHPSYENKYKGMGTDCILEAIKNDDKLGTTLHYVDGGVDTGEIIDTQEVKIDDEIIAKIKQANKQEQIELIKTHIKPKIQDAEVLMFERFWSKKLGN
jgi:folate-dependent phosphoribosylglycinamide formyltransferase PurN